MVDCDCANFGIVLSCRRWEPCPTCGRDLPARLDAFRRGALSVARADLPLSTLRRLAAALECSVGELVDKEDR
jgi:hypothetical protein